MSNTTWRNRDAMPEKVAVLIDHIAPYFPGDNPYYVNRIIGADTMGAVVSATLHFAYDHSVSIPRYIIDDAVVEATDLDNGLFDWVADEIAWSIERVALPTQQVI